MLTFTRLGTHGRLGNQLFQYAALKATALRNNYECKIPNPKNMTWHGQKCLLDQFNIESEYLTREDYNKLRYSFVERGPNYYHAELKNISDNTDLFGYFQSTYYFDGFEDQIKKELTPKARYIAKALEYIGELKEDGSELVSVHLRRGDNTDGTNRQSKYFYGPNDTLTKDSIYGKYFFKALEEFNDRKVKYLVFTGGSRTGDDKKDIEWVKNNFNLGNFVLSETNDPMEDFSLMMLCDHNITCHVTTFGWWAAFLNPNPEKIVTIPRNYFYDMPEGFERAGFIPKDWRVV